MKSLNRLFHSTCGICLVVLMLIGGALHAENPLERLVSEQGNEPVINLGLEETRIVTNDFDEYVREYVEFIYDTDVSRRVMDDQPKNIRITVPTPKGDYQLRLVQKEITTSDYRVEASADRVVYTKQLGVHYFGAVEGIENSIASASFFSGEMTLLASTRELGNFTVNKTDENGRYVSFFDSDLHEYPEFTCHTEDPEEVPAFLQDQRYMQEVLSRRGGDPCVRFHLEADYNIFQNKGSIENSVIWVEGFMAQVKLIYDLESINLLLSYVNVWDTEDPFSYLGDFSQGLDRFRTYLQTGGTLNGDFGQLVGLDGGGGGISNGIGQDACFPDYVKVQYTSVNPSFNNFPIYSWTVGAVAHELGHCIASPHTHGCYWNGDNTQIDDCGNANGFTEGEACYQQFFPILPAGGGTIMSYCHLDPVGINMSLGFGDQPGDLLRAAVTDHVCLSDCPAGECVAPGSLRVDNVTSSEATISWYHATETNFEVSYGYDGSFNTMEVNGATTVTLNGLDQGKNYEFSVKTLCTGLASYEVGGDFKTVCTTVYDLPYLELFEGDDWEVESWDLEGCWTNSLSDDFYGWSVAKGETSSADTGPLGDHTSGLGKYLFTEASFGSDGDVTVLGSPAIDMGSAVSPFIRFYYHMYGATTGSLKVNAKRQGVPGWIPLETITGQQQTGSADDWTSAFIDMSSYEGDVITLRFTGERGADFQGDIAIDDLIITDSTLVDIAVTGMESPTDGCGIGAFEQVIVTIENTGFQTLSSGAQIGLDLEVDGMPIASEAVTLSSDLEPGQFIAYEFTQTLDLSTVGTYEVKVTSTLNGDGIEANNSRGRNVINRAVVATYPYAESFEDGGNWNTGVITEDSPNTWELGTPAKDIITGASDGSNAWVTGGLSVGFYADDEYSYVESPCFDFSNLDDPVLTLDVWWDFEDGWEGARMQYSTDLGVTWVTIGSQGPNWYNYAGVWYNGAAGGDAWSGSPNHDGFPDPPYNLPNANGSGGWVEVTHPLTGLGEVPSVLLRMLIGTDSNTPAEGIAFDNVRVTGTTIIQACHEIDVQAFTCDPGQSGEDVAVLQDENGCDSVVTTMTTLLQSYDILIQDYSCNPDDTGSVVNMFTAQTSCDSIVTMRTDLWPSYDYTVNQETCDPMEVGTEDLILQTVNGCDSLVEVITTLKAPYAVMVEESSCNPADTGSVEVMLVASDGCDSVVTTNTALVPIEADFSYMDNDGVVTFTNESSDNATTYDWSFGDGNTNDTENPTNTYTTAGDYDVILIASTPGCESDTETVTITIVVSGIDLISFIESVNIFPNPNDGHFAVEIRGEQVFEDLSFTLFNVAGNELEKRDVSFNSYARETYSMDALANGIYFLRIQSDTEQTTLKVNVLR